LVRYNDIPASIRFRFSGDFFKTEPDFSYYGYADRYSRFVRVSRDRLPAEPVRIRPAAFSSRDLPHFYNRFFGLYKPVLLISICLSSKREREKPYSPFTGLYRAGDSFRAR
jgi:hypothetical protein